LLVGIASNSCKFKQIRAIEAILDNPIAIREWQMLRRRAGNWRIWVGMRWPLDPLVWGAPVILTYAIAPYLLWAMLSCFRRFHLVGQRQSLFDAMSVLALVLSLYIVAISLVLGATAITHEREQERWDQLKVTPLSWEEKGAGFLWGRLGPVWASALATAGFWWLCQPSYATLLSDWFKTGTSRSALAQGTFVTLGLSFLVGEVGLLTSVRYKNTATAVVVAVLIAVPLAIAGGAGLGGTLLLCSGLKDGVDPFGSSPPHTRAWQVANLLLCLWFLVSLCRTVWGSAMARMET
jgi:hypothetical protein